MVWIELYGFGKVSVGLSGGVSLGLDVFQGFLIGLNGFLSGIKETVYF